MAARHGRGPHSQVYDAGNLPGVTLVDATTRPWPSPFEFVPGEAHGTDKADFRAGRSVTLEFQDTKITQ
jgi:hypothetical protein